MFSSAKGINMNYQTHYDLLISRARNRILEGYSERHHIVPKCMGGTDETDNIVRLTASEHYVAHQLLVKIHPKNRKIVFAANMMTVGSSRNNKSYGWIREKNAKEMSAHILENNLHSGEKNGMFGRTHTIDARKRISEKNTGQPKPKSEETKKKMSDTWLKMMAGPDSERLRKVRSDGNKGKVVSEETREKLRIVNTGKKMSKEFCERRSELMTGENNVMFGKGHLVAGENNPMYGKTQSVETRRKISEKVSGENHPQYGTQWITNGNESMKIKKDEIIPLGWRKGRK
jgi:cobalamin biosynthesis protein CobT